MQVRSILLLGAAAVLPVGVALADGGCPGSGAPQSPAPAPAPLAARPADAGPHGGRFLTVAEHRFELVQDSRLGFVLYEAPPANGVLVLRDAPSLVLDDGSTIVLEAMPGERGAWRVRDDAALRRANLATARLRMSIDGRDQTVAIASPADRSSAAVPTGFVETAAGAHGGRMLLLGSGMGRVEWLHDPRAGKVTVFAVDSTTDAAHPGRLENLVLSLDGDRRLELKRDTDGTFAVTDESLRDANASLTLKGELDGKSFEKRIDAQPADAKTEKNEAQPLPGDRNFDPARDAADPRKPAQPVEPRAWGEKPAPGADVTAPEGASSALVFGDNVARLEARRDARLGRLTLVAPAGSRASIEDAPILVLDTRNGPRELTFEKSEGNTWILTSDQLKDDSLAGTVKIRVDGRSYESKLGITTRGTTERGTTRDGTTKDGTTTDGTTTDGTTKEGTTRDGASGYGK